MKKTMLVLFQEIGMKALAGFVLAIALTFAASTSLSAQNSQVPTPVEKLQIQLDYINDDILGVLNSTHPKYEYYEQMADYLQAVLDDVNQNGMSLHEAYEANASLRPISPAQKDANAKIGNPPVAKPGNG